MFGGEILVVALSAVPLIENRGAMFLGFALGITDPLVYAAGTALNVASMPFWSAAIRRIPLSIRPFAAKPLAHLPLLVALPYTGVNMASVLYFFPRLFSAPLREVYAYLALGIALRGLVTYLFLIGMIAFIPLHAVLAVLVAWYVLAYLAQKLIWKK